LVLVEEIDRMIGCDFADRGPYYGESYSTLWCEVSGALARRPVCRNSMGPGDWAVGTLRAGPSVL